MGFRSTMWRFSRFGGYRGTPSIMSIKVKPVLPIRFNARAINDALESLVQELVEEAETDFQRTVATWARKPVFHKRVRRSFAQILGEVTTTDRLYRFIDLGTSKGYAEMTPGWSPKTRPGVIGSFPGSGRRRRLNFFRPKPGVKARSFSQVIGEKFQGELNRRSPKVMAEAAKRSGHYFG